MLRRAQTVHRQSSKAWNVAHQRQLQVLLRLTAHAWKQLRLGGVA